MPEDATIGSATARLNYLLLQINDAAFPIGSYAHSFGLETVIQEQRLPDEASAAAWLRSYLSSSLLYGELLPARMAYDAASAGDWPDIEALEERSLAARSPRELREAATLLGARFVKTAGALLAAPTLFSEYTARRSGQHHTLSIAYGVFCAAASIDRQQALAAFTFSQASASVNVCVKSVPLSQTAGQRLLVNLHPLFDTLVTGVEQLDERMLWASTPALDIAAMRHERLYSRLYMS